MLRPGCDAAKLCPYHARQLGQGDLETGADAANRPSQALRDPDALADVLHAGKRKPSQWHHEPDPDAAPRPPGSYQANGWRCRHEGAYRIPI